MDRLISHYRLLSPLGTGGMGEVYAGIDETLKRRVALKAIRPEHRLSPVAKAQFLREARVLSQLDHPNICRIYDYIEEDHGDWLVLELIEGKSLQAALPAIELGSRLRIAQQIADVLVATHTAGIVHRDLKPGNVMLTRGDEVKVLDFGIAQAHEPAMQSAAPAERHVDVPAPHPPHDSDVTMPATDITAATGWIHVATEGGALVGTPAYMSPEQARGEPATPASDMYSFGLLLQDLYTGRPPYPRDIGPAELLDRARRADTLPPAGAPSDVAALIARLKQLAPAQRPTAVEAAARLGWIRDRPKRLLRRAVAAVVLLAAVLGAAKYAVHLARERTIAVEAREEAERRRTQAEELIGFMLGDLRKQLEPVGRLDILDDVGAQAMNYFAAVPAAALSDEELLRRSAALYQIGDVRIAQGNLEAATSPLQDSLALAQTLAERQPGNGDRLFGLAQSHYWVGYVHWRRHDLQAARREFEAYLDVATRLAALDPSRGDWQIEVAYANSNLGSVLQAEGDLDGALSRFQACLVIEEALLATSPDDMDLQRSVASSHNTIGLVLRSSGRLDDALGEFGRELAIRQTQSATDPGNFTYRLRLAVSHTHTGLVLAAQGTVADAAAALERALALLRELDARDPANRTWQREIAAGHANFAAVQMASGRPEAAAPLLDRAVRIMRTLAEGDPTNAGWQRDLADYRRARGGTSLARGELRSAADDASAALAAASDLLARPGGDLQAARIASAAHAVLARVSEARGDPALARTHWERALASIPAAARHAGDYRFLDPLAVALLRLDRPAEAAPVLERLRAMGYRDPLFLAQIQETWGLPPEARSPWT
jgi:eukaryotic-like serine/threonine-protein kinase